MVDLTFASHQRLDVSPEGGKRGHSQGGAAEWRGTKGEGASVYIEIWGLNELFEEKKNYTVGKNIILAVVLSSCRPLFTPL